MAKPMNRMTTPARLIEILEAVEMELANAVAEADSVNRLTTSDDESMAEAMSALEDLEGLLDPIQSRLRVARADLSDMVEGHSDV